IGVSVAQTNVSSYVVDLNRVKLIGSEPPGSLPAEIPPSQPTPCGSSLRRNYERPTTTCSKPNRVSPSSDEDEKESSAEIQNPEEFKEIFQPKNAISRTPPHDSEPFPAPPEDVPVCPFSPPVLYSAECVPPEVTTPGTAIRKNRDQLIRPPMASSTPTVIPDPPSAPPPPNHPPVISAARKEPIGLKAADFLPVVKSSSPAEVGDEDAMGQIRKGHDTMCMVLTSRMRNLDTVRAVWSSGDIK
ncbi:katanin p80 WD40 repeat-containing subunit B1, partial [Mantella aurantiaca]